MCRLAAIRGNVIGPRADGVNGPALVTADAVEAISYDDNDHRFESLGYGWTLPITGNRWSVRGNRFRGGGAAVNCIEVASASHSRCVIQNNVIKNYNGVGVKTNSSGGKNVVGGNCFEAVTTPTNVAGTDTAYDNTNQT